jgi:hypothetical protein
MSESSLNDIKIKTVKRSKTKQCPQDGNEAEQANFSPFPSIAKMNWFLNF